MRELTKTELLYIISLIVSFVFFFLSVGLLMGNGANVAIPYAALFTAIALSGSTLIVGFVNTRKTVILLTNSKPIVPFVQVAYLQVPVEKSVVFASPAKNEQRVQKVENNYREQKIEPIDTLITLPVDDQKREENSIAQPTIEAKSENQKTIKLPEKTPTQRKALKSTSSKKTAAKRAKAKARKTKGS